MKISKILSFPEVYSSLSTQKIPIRLAYKLNKLNTYLEPELNFYSSSLNKLVLEYAQTSPAGDPLYNAAGTGILIKTDKINECQSKIRELGEIDIELPNITFTLDELDSLEITPSELQVLMPFITE